MEEKKEFRIGLMSDTHGNLDAARRAIQKAGEVDAWLHMGDGAADVDVLQSECNVPFYCVRGNCDISAKHVPADKIITFGEYPILMTHGNNYGVEMSLYRLQQKMAELGCIIALFGHTHIAEVKYVPEGIIANPGSVSRGRLKCTYGILTINYAGPIIQIYDL